MPWCKQRIHDSLGLANDVFVAYTLGICWTQHISAIKINRVVLKISIYFKIKLKNYQNRKSDQQNGFNSRNRRFTQCR
ncbi:hypothetical protein LOOC260_102140 [Paucilactobacillus hokkaidonensis JCM 18461]|uniref:Uncharacterized protein n=1 Tax=Paucilactobacillus hokkaidonensis JCM 18461 TaxID=1291742 RepID=A0A0A1GR68_9LACO|nr:hypothetical protein LOOC260_102140 [Paucilactobacillus hokkaidonensis JCM 18461]